MAKKKKTIGGVVSQEYETVDIDSIQPHEKNCNEGDLGAVIESIDANGFIGAIIVQRSSGNIIAGKHRWLALKDRGVKRIPVIMADVDDATALRFMLADNRTNRLGADNPQALAELLESIRSNEGTLAGTGFDEEALQELLDDMSNSFVGDTEPDSDEPEAEPAIESQEREFKIVVDCDDETNQSEILDRLKAEGFACHALTN